MSDKKPDARKELKSEVPEGNWTLIKGEHPLLGKMFAAIGFIFDGFTAKNKDDKENIN